MQHFRFFSILLLLCCVPLVVLPQGYICAIGGGSENYGDWSDAPYRWIVQKANTGKVIILSVNDETTWLPTYFTSFGASSAVNKKINTRAIADLQATYDEIVSARAVFIKGGDQWNYINYWKGTKTEQAILAVFANGGVIAGTSAGAMVLGGTDFSAQVASPTSREVLANPFSASVTFETNFLNLVPGALFDTHVAERGRGGRTIGMLVKAKQALSAELLGVAVDDMTALCIDTNGIGTVLGSGSVAFYYPGTDTRFTLMPPNWYVSRLRCDMLTANWQFNLRARQVAYIPPSARAFTAATLPPNTAARVITTGNNQLTPQLQQILRLLPKPASGCMVLYTYSFRDSAAVLFNQLSAGGYVFSKAMVSLATANSAPAAADIAAADRFILLGDSLAAFAPLRDTATLLGRAFATKPQSASLFFAIGGASKLLGGAYADNTDTDGLAGYRGKMTVNPGFAALPFAVMQPLTYDNSTYYENRTTALPYTMMRAGRPTGIYTDGTGTADYTAVGGIITGTGALPLYVLDATAATFADSSVYRASSSVGPRQIAALNNLRVSLCNFSGYAYSLSSRDIVLITGIRENTAAPVIASVYPNPSRGEFIIPVAPYDVATITLCTVTGKQLQHGTFVADASGRIAYAARGVPLGVYVLLISSRRHYYARKVIIY